MIKHFFKKVKDEIINLIYPCNITCEFCENDLFNNEFPNICSKCYVNLPFIANPCQKCGKEIVDNKCDHCTAVKPYFKKAISVFSYNDQMIDIIHKFKFGGGFYLSKLFSHFLYKKYIQNHLSCDCVVAAPMNAKKLLSRKYNQAQLLVDEFCALSHLPDASSCVVKDDISSQRNLSSIARKKNIYGSMKIIDNTLIRNKKVLIIDDVFTTGATTSELARILKLQGATEIFVLTVCNVPNTK